MTPAAFLAPAHGRRVLLPARCRRVLAVAFGLAIGFAVAVPPSAAAQATRSLERAAPAPGPLLDINTATAAELAALPGLGPKRAGAIVAARSRRRFDRLTQLLLIRGIGPRVLRQLKGYLVVGPKGVPAPQPSTRAEKHPDASGGLVPTPEGGAAAPPPSAGLSAAGSSGGGSSGGSSGSSGR